MKKPTGLSETLPFTKGKILLNPNWMKLEQELGHGSGKKPICVGIAGGLCHIRKRSVPTVENLSEVGCLTWEYNCDNMNSPHVETKKLHEE